MGPFLPLLKSIWNRIFEKDAPLCDIRRGHGFRQG